MADYMREIIYLKKIKKGIPMSGDGFARLNKKGGRLTICLAVQGEETGYRQPVYLIYEKNGSLKPYMAGKSGEGETTEIIIETGQAKAVPEEICGVLVGEASCYWSGPCKKYRREILYEQIDFPKTNSQTAANGLDAPETGSKQSESDRLKSKPIKSELAKAMQEKDRSHAKAASLSEMPAQEPEKWMEPFLKKLSEMYPFEDDEMEWCLQMEPTDFTSFPMEFWHYARNSFLLQGFYNYRHLLYAHGGEKNYIGVPGQFHRREQYLANRFGFPRFKGTQKKRVTIGDFGYWLKEL